MNIYMCIYTSSSSCHAASTHLPDPLLLPVSIVHHTQEVLQATFCIGTDLTYTATYLDTKIIFKKYPNWNCIYQVRNE